MNLRVLTVACVLLALGLLPPPVAAQTTAPSARMILALGNTAFLNPTDIQAATGAQVKPDLEKFQLKDFAVIVLANVAFGALPEPVQDGLEGYVNEGGVVLITGGSQSFGSGGYQAVAPILPFQIWVAGDWKYRPPGSPVPVQSDHPILTGVSFTQVLYLNEMNLRPGAVEILRATGGRGRGYPPPLIAEAASGAGRVLGIAFDLNEFAGMRDRDLFVRNILTYLLAASRMGQGR